MTGAESLLGRRPSVREMQVVALVAHGKSNAQIAAELWLAESTVREHLANVGAKLGMDNRAGIVGAAICRGHLVVLVTGTPPAGFNEGLYDVLVRVARGRSNHQIAAELVISHDAVKTRIRRLLSLLQVKSREEAVVAGVACGALPLVRRRERVAA